MHCFVFYTKRADAGRKMGGPRSNDNRTEINRWKYLHDSFVKVSGTTITRTKKKVNG